MKTKKEELKEEIEKLKMCLNTYLESSYDIEDFSMEDIYFEIINSKSSVEILTSFLSNLKDYWKLQAELKGYQEGKAEALKKVEEVINGVIKGFIKSVNPNSRKLQFNQLDFFNEYKEIREELKQNIKEK